MGVAMLTLVETSPLLKIILDKPMQVMLSLLR